MLSLTSKITILGITLIAISLTFSYSSVYATHSDFDRVQKVFDDDFETFTGWNTIGTGIVTQQNVGSGNTVSGDNIARKTTNDDPNGANKQFSQTIDDFEMVVYAKKINNVGGTAIRYAITQDQTGNGYGFYLSNNVLVIETRSSTFGKSTLDSTSSSWDLNQWNTFQFTKIGNELTLKFFKNQIVNPDNIETTTPSVTRSVINNNFSGGFNFASINGGNEFDTDDFMVWEINPIIPPDSFDLQQQIDDIISGVIAIMVDWSNIKNIPADIADGDDDTLSGLGCTTDQIAKFDGVSWICSQDEINDSDNDSANELQIMSLVGNILSLSNNGGDITLPNDGSTSVNWLDIVGIPASIADGDDDTLSGLGCTTDQIAKFDGTEWICIDFGNSEQLFSTYTVNGQTVSIPPGVASGFSKAYCNSGDVMLSGGWASTNPHNILATQSTPRIDGDASWGVQFTHVDNGGSTQQGHSIGLCLDLTP